LDADRPDLELAFIALEDDAVILVSLGVDDSAQIYRSIPHDSAGVAPEQESAP
jgi:hypothetical protein